MSLLKLVGILLDYPADELWNCGDELLDATGECGLPARRREELAGFIQTLLASDPLEAQERWLALFDRGRSMSLLMFEHIHGESRDRGQAMVDLVDIYRRNGFEISARELPDYLPLLLEYLAQRPAEEGRDWLGHLGPIIHLLAARATERNSPYALLFEILAECTGVAFDREPMRQRAREESRDDTPEAMDQVWEEEVVRFGAEAPNDDCAPSGRPRIQPAEHRQVQP